VACPEAERPQLPRTAQFLAEHGRPDHDLTAAVARRRIAECDRKLAQHRAALEAGADPTVITQWMAETQAQRVAAQAQLRQTGGQRRMTGEEIETMVNALGGLVQVLFEAESNDKAEIYAQLGLRLTYRPQEQLVEAQLQPNLHMCERYVSEGGLEPPCPSLGTSTSS
jgi:site-specific DNA recombinase